MRNANKMADSLQLDGSKSKVATKILTNVNTETSTLAQLNTYDASKLKKSRSDKSEKSNNDNSSVVNGNDSINSTNILSSVNQSAETNGITTPIVYQVNYKLDKLD